MSLMKIVRITIFLAIVGIVHASQAEEAKSKGFNFSVNMESVTPEQMHDMKDVFSACVNGKCEDMKKNTMFISDKPNLLSTKVSTDESGFSYRSLFFQGGATTREKPVDGKYVEVRFQADPKTDGRMVYAPKEVMWDTDKVQWMTNDPEMKIGDAAGHMKGHGSLAIPLNEMQSDGSLKPTQILGIAGRGKNKVHGDVGNLEQKAEPKVSIDRNWKEESRR